MTNPVNFPTLDRRQTKIAGDASYHLASALSSYQNGLCEAISGLPAEQNPRLSIKAHNHQESLGTTLPRGVIYCLDWGGFAQGDYYTTTASGFFSFFSWKPSFYAFVSPGIDSSVDREGGSGKAKLYANLLVKTSTHAFDIKIKNTTPGMLNASSSVKTTSVHSGYQEIEFTDIPCKGGVWNSFELLVDGGAASRTIHLYSLHLVETRTHSQPKSSGTTVFSSL